MLEVKQKYAPKLLVAGNVLTVLLTFKYYCMDLGDGVLNQSYYVMMNETPKCNDDDDK